MLPALFKLLLLVLLEESLDIVDDVFDGFTRDGVDDDDLLGHNVGRVEDARVVAVVAARVVALINVQRALGAVKHARVLRHSLGDGVVANTGALMMMMMMMMVG